MAYKAQIEFTAYEDDYSEGDSGVMVSSWNEILTAGTQSELRDKILETTYSKWEDVDDDQMNEYDWCTEYHTSYLAYLVNADNQGDASESEIADWKKGKQVLCAINCHILVTEVTEKKASL